MQVFVRVVEQGAFVRAADTLGISRAGATAAIAALEGRLGARLLNRTTRRLSLTDEGRSYYEACVRVLGEIAEAEDSVSGARLLPRGRLRLSMPQSFVDKVFFPALTRFMQRYPQLGIELVLTDRAVNLVEEGIDCALRAAELPPDSGLVARQLSAVCWVTCASPAYLAAQGTPRSIGALGQHECIRFISPSTGRPRDWEFVHDGKRTSIVPHGHLRLTSLNAAIEAAVAGAGIAQVPDALAFGAILAGELEPILTEYIASAPSLMLIYAGNRYLTAKVRAFAEFFAEVFPREGWWPTVAAKAAVARPRGGSS